MQVTTVHVKKIILAALITAGTACILALVQLGTVPIYTY